MQESRFSFDPVVREASEIHTFLFGEQSSNEMVHFYRRVFKLYLTVCFLLVK